MRQVPPRERMKRAWRSRGIMFRFPVHAMPPRRLLALACAILSPGTLWAETQTVVRVTAGEHPHFGRVVLDAPGLAYTTDRDGDHVLIRFPGDPALGELPPAPHDVVAIRAVTGGVELTVPPGANVHTSRMGSKVVVDIDETAPGRAPPGIPAQGIPATGNSATGNPLTGNPPSNVASADAARPESAASVRNRGRIPWQPPVSVPAIKPTSPEPTTGRGEPIQVSPPAGMPAKQDAATTPGHDLLRSDSAISADLRLAASAPTGANVAPGPLATGTKAAAPGTPPEMVAIAPPPAEPPKGPPDEPGLTPGGSRSAVPARTPEGLTTAAPGGQQPGGQLAAGQQPQAQPGGTAAGTPGGRTEDAGTPGVRSEDSSERTSVGPPPGWATAPPGDPPLGQIVTGSRPDTPPAAAMAQPLAIQVWPVTRDAIPSGPVALLAIKSRPPGGLEGVAV